MNKNFLNIFCAFAFIVLVFAGCKKNLNDKFFNSAKIEKYSWDDYTGEVDFTLPPEYDIEDSLVHLITLYSKGKDETDSIKIYGVYIGELKKIASSKVILYLHGNKDHMDFYWPRAKLLANAGGKNKYGVMMIDYRGYGMSEGKSTEESMYADTRSAIDWLVKKGVKRYTKQICAYGFSLGSTPATEMAYSLGLPVSWLILEAPMASAATLVADGSGLNIDPLFYTSFKFDNVKKIRKIQMPFYWLHGTKDKYLDINSNGQLLFDSYEGTAGQASKIEGAGHGEVPEKMGFQTYCDSIGNFILKH